MRAIAVPGLAAGDVPAQQLPFSQSPAPLVGPRGHVLTLSHRSVATAALAGLGGVLHPAQLGREARLARGDGPVQLGEDLGLVRELCVVYVRGDEGRLRALVL